MKIGIPIKNNFPEGQEVRTRKIAKALDRHQHMVSIFARNTLVDVESGGVRTDLPSESLKYATIHRFSWFRRTPLFRLLTAPVPLNPFWFIWLLFQFHRTDCDVIIVGGLRASFPSIIAARLLGIPVIVDLRENYPAWAATFPKDTLFDRLQTNPTLIRFFERVAIRYADFLWVVVRERKEDLITDGVPASKIRVVSNTPDRSEYGLEQTTPQPSTYSWPGFALIYIGALQELRGLDRLIEALTYLPPEDDDIILVIGGTGEYQSALERTCERLGVTDRVIFAGWIDPLQIPAFLASGEIGVIPHKKTRFTDTTVPNKLFDYMMVGLPILATNMAPVTRILRETSSGITFPPGATPEQLAHCISQAKSLFTTYGVGDHGRRAVETEYNWERETTVILDTLEHVTENDARPSD